MTLSEFTLPALGADMDDGTVVEWKVAPGQAVKRGDVVAVVETDKGAIDVEIFLDGTVREILVPVGTKVPVGTPLARIETADARAQVSPAARRRAHELAIDLAVVRGSGPGGAITVDDVERARTAASTEAAAPAPPQAPAAAAPTPPTGEARAGMREAIAGAMSRSNREIPHYYLTMSIDVTPVLDWLAARNAAVAVTERVLFPALLVKALALACRELAGLSGFYLDGRYVASEAVHVGVAVALRGGGLVAPAILDTDRKPLVTVMAEFRDLVTRARAGRLRASELSAPTIILTSLGDDASIEAVLPIIQPPQVAIVGAGAVLDRPLVVDGAVVARKALTLSLAADHRVTDGRFGAQFLARMAAKLAHPDAL
jgi:pyruvate dehydrogenase E2 component (dihydrolipoamide acetyltransferase)